MSDQITVLRSETKRMAKVWKADGSIAPYDLAKYFTHEPRAVENIQALSTLLTELEADPHRCIVRGTPSTDISPLRRLIENFEDNPLHSILVEIDGYQPVLSDPVLDPLGSALEYIAECLPTVFHGASFHFQLSNSAGAPGKESTFKAHIWMWLETPYSSAVLRAWAKAENLALDRAVLQPVQVHYVSAPVFEPGVVDPVPLRSGFHQGTHDSVPLVIDVEALEIKAQGVRQRGERLDIADPLADWIESNWECWGTQSDGGIITTCPFNDLHSSGEKGTSATVYFPAGTNQHADGSWICLHSGCRDRPKQEFLAACGYTDQRLASLAVDEAYEPDSQDSILVARSKTLLALKSPLPNFARTPGGEILPTVGNIKSAMGRPDVTGMTLRLDRFKEDLVWAAPESTHWTLFKDTNYFDLQLRLESIGFKPLSKDALRDAVHHQADEDSFDTAIDWLSGLEWDGVPRVETFWIDHFGVIDDERGYARAVGRYTWTALAGRALEPGVQADMAPILTGPQGIGKSRGVAAMSPVREFATIMSFSEPEVERARKMRGKLIVELAELQGLKSREREEIKAWITRSDEHWTPKFKEMSITFRRRFLCVGTTNDDDFLDDPTGERRWLPLGVGKAPGFVMVDRDAIARERSQLWAEGKARFLSSGVDWSDAQRLAGAEHETYRSEDTWRSAIGKWLDTPGLGGETPRGEDHLTTQRVAEGALSIPARHLKYADQRKIGTAMRGEGYDLRPKRVEGKLTKVWVAVK